MNNDQAHNPSVKQQHKGTHADFAMLALGVLVIAITTLIDSPVQTQAWIALIIAVMTGSCVGYASHTNYRVRSITQASEKARNAYPTSLAWAIGLIALVLFCNTAAAINSPVKADVASQARLVETYGKLPLSFEVNQGQTDKMARFLARGTGYGLFLTPTGAVLSLHKPKPPTSTLATPALGASAKKPPTNAIQSNQDKAATLRMKLVGGNPNPHIQGLDELPGKVNYFRGKDPKQWHTHIPTYAKVKYEKVYPGIDLIYYGNQRQLEYDFIVAPGADPKAVRLAFDGADQLTIDKQGDLVLKSGDGDVRLRKPRVYQDINGQQREIEGRYVLHPAKRHSKGKVSFQVAAYDKSKPLVIDPVLVYSTYLGGSNSEAICGSFCVSNMGIAVDTQGNAYLAGSTASLDFPTTAGAFDTTHNPFGDSGYTDAFVVKLNAEGSALLYATYLGGIIQVSTMGTDIAVDNQGNAYVIGTGSGRGGGFPTTNGAYDTFAESDGFVTKLDSTGSALVYSTFLGGSGVGVPNAVALDTQGNAYVTGITPFTPSGNFSVTPGAFDTTANGLAEAFVVKLNPIGSSLIYSTYLGGINTDLGNDIAVDDAGNAYIAGRTDSSDFPTTPGAFDTSFNQVHGGFITKLNATGSALVYSTFLGGSTDNNELLGIALDGTGNAYTTGTTYQADFPTTPGAFDTSFNGTTGVPDDTVSKLNASGTALIYSTYLGGSDSDNGSGISVDTAGNAAVTGYTCSTDFPSQNPLQAANAGDCDSFVVKFDSTGSSLIYATYLGGSIGFPGQSAFDSGSSIAVDGVGNVYVAGTTASSDFPTTVGALKTSNNGNVDVFVAKISDDTTPPPPQPVLTVTPSSLDFGAVTVGTSKDLEFMVKNTGGSTLAGDASTSEPFSIVSGGSFSLAAGASQAVIVRFSPTTASSFSGNLSFTSNGGSASPLVAGAGALDTDGDGMPDVFEIANDLNPNDPSDAGLDSDGDGLNNLFEYSLGTDIDKVDTDGDGVSDFEEMSQGSNPLDPLSIIALPKISAPQQSKVLLEAQTVDCQSQNADLTLIRSRPTIVLTHGMSNVNERDTAPNSLWIGSSVGQAAALIRSSNPDVNIIQYVWEGAFKVDNAPLIPSPRPDRYDYFLARKDVPNAGTALAQRLLCLLGNEYSQPIHFIGHSLGTAVNAYAANLFLQRATSLPRAQFTALDRPHHVNDIDPTTLARRFRFIPEEKDPRVDSPEEINKLPTEDQTFLASDNDSTDFESKYGYGSEFFASLLQDIRSGLDLKIDNYYTLDGKSGVKNLDGLGAGVGDVADGPVYNHRPDAINCKPPVRKDQPECEGLESSFKVGNTFYSSEAGLYFVDNNHSGVQQWYRWTINPNHSFFTEKNRDSPWCFGESIDTADPLTSEKFLAKFNLKLNPCGSGWFWSINKSFFPNSFPSNNGKKITASRLPLPDFQNIDQRGCDVSNAPVIKCTEQSSPYVNARVLIPPDAKFISFEYQFQNIGDGDYAAVLIDDMPIWVLSGSSYFGNEFVDSGPIPIEGWLGDRKITIALYGVGDKNAEFVIQNFSYHIVNDDPTANAGSDQTVRLGSVVTLNGSTSSDPDNAPSPLSYAWTQTDGPGISLTDASTAGPRFTASVKGFYTFNLVVNDGESDSPSASVKITVPTLGDIDLDGDVDSNDLARITAVLNKPANGPNDLRDINGDLKIDALDSRKLVLLCTRPRCATQ